MNLLSLTRRQTLAGLAATSALPLLSSPAFGQAADPAAEARANALLDSIAENLLRLYPEQATSARDRQGRPGAIALDADRPLRDRPTADRADGSRRPGAGQRGRPWPLSHSTRTSIEVVRSAYASALEGFMLPYGDLPVAGDSWRKTPYVVIQNTGAYLDVPKFLDSDHQIANADDAEAYLARLASYPQQLDNELGRVIAYRYKGLIPPAFLIDIALTTARAIGHGRAQRRRPGRIDRAPDARETHPGQLGRARSRHRREGGRAGAGPPDRRAPASARPCHQRRRNVGAAQWRRILSLGASRADDDRQDAPTRSIRSDSTRSSRCMRRWTRS